MATTHRRDPQIVMVIGAGVAGIATAVTFKQAGFHNFVIVEKGSDVGGVWHWNRYPGLTCDVPSQIYQFSFAPKPDWRRVWATGAEIQRYHRDVVEKFSLTEHLLLESEVVGARFGDDGWRVSIADGRELRADFVIAATGVLHHPFTPDIPGLDGFTGSTVHTARWDDCRSGPRASGSR
ncbi:flavin-containing monooxygenase [Microbacterium aurum]